MTVAPVLLLVVVGLDLLLVQLQLIDRVQVVKRDDIKIHILIQVSRANHALNVLAAPNLLLALQQQIDHV